MPHYLRSPTAGHTAAQQATEILRTNQINLSFCRDTGSYGHTQRACEKSVHHPWPKSKLNNLLVHRHCVVYSWSLYKPSKIVLLALIRQSVWFQLWLLAFKLWWNQGISYPTWVSQTLIIISALFSLRMRTLDPNQINKPPNSRCLSELELRYDAKSIKIQCGCCSAKTTCLVNICNSTSLSDVEKRCEMIWNDRKNVECLWRSPCTSRTSKSGGFAPPCWPPDVTANRNLAWPQCVMMCHVMPSAGNS